MRDTERAIDEYEFTAPSGRRYVFRRRTRAERVRSGLEPAFVLVFGGAVQALNLAPFWRLLVGW